MSVCNPLSVRCCVITMSAGMQDLCDIYSTPPPCIQAISHRISGTNTDTAYKVQTS